MGAGAGVRNRIGEAAKISSPQGRPAGSDSVRRVPAAPHRLPGGLRVETAADEEFHEFAATHRIGQVFRPRPPADLLVCSDVMHYVPSAELKRGLQGFAELCAGVAYLDVFCREDAITGDFQGFIARPRAAYRKLFQDAGFTALGSHCYLSPACDSPVAALERL